MLPSFIISTYSFTAGFILDKTIAVNSPKRMENAKILIANTCKCLHRVIPLHSRYTSNFSAMDTDKVKIFGARVKVDSTGKLAELERAERVRIFSALPTHTFSFLV